MNRYLATIFQQEYSNFVKGPNGKHDNSIFSGLVHDTMIAKQTEARIAREMEEAKKTVRWFG